MPDWLARWYFDAPVQEIDTGTARLPCRRFGSGPPLLFVHGFPLSGFTWRKILPALAERFTCWVPDLPGLGDSAWTDATDFSFPGQGRTLKALVDRLGLERYSVVAQDTGGTFARCLALEDGARIDKLVLINTEIPGHRPPWIPLYQLLMQIPGATIPFSLLLRSSAFLRSGMGFGGCWCTWFHSREGRPEGEMGRPWKERLVREGTAHAALVFDGADCVGWCQFGAPGEVPAVIPTSYGQRSIVVEREIRSDGSTAISLRGGGQ